MLVLLRILLLVLLRHLLINHYWILLYIARWNLLVLIPLNGLHFEIEIDNNLLLLFVIIINKNNIAICIIFVLK
jgi:hypothetical protein